MTLSGASGADEIPSGPVSTAKAEESKAPVTVADTAADESAVQVNSGELKSEITETLPVVVDVPLPVKRPPPIKDRVVARSRHEICATVVESAHSNDLPLPFFIHLLFQESGFKPDVVSRAGAQGIAQFMPETAAIVGLNNPFDPIQAIAASARLLGNLVQQFGNLGLAAAAYNAGPRRIQDWLDKKGKLPDETKHYVRTITGRPAETWKSREKGQLAAVLPREAPCQEAVTVIAAKASAGVKTAQGKTRDKKDRKGAIQLAASSKKKKDRRRTASRH